jgi:hypothetical protein
MNLDEFLTELNKEGYPDAIKNSRIVFFLYLSNTLIWMPSIKKLCVILPIPSSECPPSRNRVWFIPNGRAKLLPEIPLFFGNRANRRLKFLIQQNWSELNHKPWLKPNGRAKLLPEILIFLEIGRMQDCNSKFDGLNTYLFLSRS